MNHEYTSPRDQGLPKADVVLIGSENMPEGITVSQEIKIGEKSFSFEGLSRKGQIYSGIKKNTEDGTVVLKNAKALTAIVVDGGTQVDHVQTLDAQELSGGTYIKNEVEKNGRTLSSEISVAENLRRLNQKIGEDMKREHPSVDYSEHSHNTPYGSIAGVKIDVLSKTLEVANAGDVFVVGVDNNLTPILLSTDDVYAKDQQTFSVTKKLAQEHGVTFRHAMQNRTTDERFRPIVDETFETMRRGNTGEIRRITGAPNFDVTSAHIFPLYDFSEIFLFTDGAVPGGIDIHEQQDLIAWYNIVKDQGLEGINQAALERASSDPDFDKYPRFGNVDDFMLIRIKI